MSKCWNCGTELTLKDEEIKCDSCGKIVNFCCNSCHKWFSLYDEKKETKIKECSICGFFVCPYCGTCSPSCNKELWQIDITKILSPEITYSKFPNLQEKINLLLELIEDIKVNHDQVVCPERKVSITYAKNKIKSCVVRTEGYRCKNLLDVQKFRERLEKIGNVDIGIQLTINQSREEGTYGQEYRDVFNTCVCLGKLKKEIIKKDFDGTLKEIEVWRRVEIGQCPYLDLTDLIIKVCPNPKCKINKFPLEAEYCHECIYQKGKNKGQPYKLRLKISNKDICKLNRGLFKKEDGRIKIQGDN